MSSEVCDKSCGRSDRLCGGRDRRRLRRPAAGAGHVLVLHRCVPLPRLLGLLPLLTATHMRAPHPANQLAPCCRVTVESPHVGYGMTRLAANKVTAVLGRLPTQGHLESRLPRGGFFLGRGLISSAQEML